MISFFKGTFDILENKGNANWSDGNGLGLGLFNDVKNTPPND